MKFVTFIAVSALLLGGCKTDTATPADAAAFAQGKKLCPDGSQMKGNQCPTPTAVTPSTPSTPTTTPTTTTVDVASPMGLGGEADIADNFDTAAWIEPGEAPQPDLDPAGAFRFTCLAGQLAKDDPIVYPGQPGKSHLHQFFGNSSTNASSNYQSLRTTGGSSCTRTTGQSPQRTAYWTPAMLDGAGNAVKPDWINTYYKRLPASDPTCGAPDASHIGKCIRMPNGLRYILGYNMANGTGGPTDVNSIDQWKMGFDCVNRTDGGSFTGTRPTIAAIVATGQCPAGAWLRVFVTFPDCWDGVHLDTADHRAHMAYADGPVIQGRRACPADHPYNIPEIAVQEFFSVDANFFAGRWHLASDEMMAGTTAGSTLHFDYWEAWSPAVKAIWQDNCIDKHHSCSAGNLGDGTQVHGMQQVGPFPSHVLVPVSSIP